MNIKTFTAIATALSLGAFFMTSCSDSGKNDQSGNEKTQASSSSGPKKKKKKKMSKAEACKKLLEKKIIDTENDVEKADAEGSTLLMAAASKGDVEIAKLLIAAGANVNARTTDELQWTPLIHAAEAGHANVVRLLLKSGADPNVQDAGFGMTALMYACHKEREEVVEEMLKHPGVNLDLMSKNSSSAVVYAIVNENAEIASALKEAGCRMKNAEGDSFLYAAVSNGSMPAVSFLLKIGVSPDACAADGTTPLMAAAAYGNAQLVRLLLGHGANVNARDRDGMNAYHYANFGKHPNVANILKAAGADTSFKIH